MNSSEVSKADDAAKLLTFIDTQEIESLDPCIEDGHHINSEKELPMEVSIKSSQRQADDL